MKFELLNTRDEVVLSAEMESGINSWIFPMDVTYVGNTSLLEWFNTPVPGEIIESCFKTAAHKHGLRYKCDTFHVRPH